MITIAYDLNNGYTHGNIIISSVGDKNPILEIDASPSKPNSIFFLYELLPTEDIIAQDVCEFVRQITDMMEQGEINAISNIDNIFVKIAIAENKEWLLNQLKAIIERRTESENLSA